MKNTEQKFIYITIANNDSKKERNDLIRIHSILSRCVAVNVERVRNNEKEKKPLLKY